MACGSPIFGDRDMNGVISDPVSTYLPLVRFHDRGSIARVLCIFFSTFHFFLQRASSRKSKVQLAFLKFDIFSINMTRGIQVSRCMVCAVEVIFGSVQLGAFA